MIGESGQGDSGGDLGGMMPGGSPPQGGGSGASTWQSLVNDPVSRSALISMGLQLMAGSHGGSPVQNLGLAIGAGAEGAGNTAKAIQSQQINDRDFQAKQEEGDKNRASHEKIGQMGADSRNEVAQIRSEAMIQRAAMIHKPQNSQEMQIYSKAAGDYMKKEKDNQIISKKTDSQIQFEADAWGKSILDSARNSSGVRSMGAPLGGEGAQLGAPESGVVKAPGPAGASAKAAPEAKGGPNVQFRDYLADLSPDEVKMLNSSKEAQNALLAQESKKGNTEFVRILKDYLRERGGYPAAEKGTSKGFESMGSYGSGVP